MSKLSENIKYYRKDGKLTQKALSEKLNVSNKTLSHWENYYSQPSIEQLVMLANIFEISLDELVGRTM